MTYGNRNPRPTHKDDADFSVSAEPVETGLGIDIFLFDVRFAVAELEPGAAEAKMRDLAATLEDEGWTTQARELSDAADELAHRLKE